MKFLINYLKWRFTSQHSLLWLTLDTLDSAMLQLLLPVCKIDLSGGDNLIVQVVRGQICLSKK